MRASSNPFRALMTCAQPSSIGDLARPLQGRSGPGRRKEACLRFGLPPQGQCRFDDVNGACDNLHCLRHGVLAGHGRPPTVPNDAPGRAPSAPARRTLNAGRAVPRPRHAAPRSRRAIPGRRRAASGMGGARNGGAAGRSAQRARLREPGTCGSCARAHVFMGALLVLAGLRERV